MGKSATTNAKELESPIQARIRLAVGARNDFILNRINTGVFLPIDWMPGKPKRVIRSAPTGFPDLCGIQVRRVQIVEMVNPNSFQPLERKSWHYYGQAIFIETKSATGKQREEQFDFQEAVEGVGGIYILARSVEDVLEVLGDEPDLSTWDAEKLPANWAFKKSSAR